VFFVFLPTSRALWPSPDRIPEVSDDLPGGQTIFLSGLGQIMNDERQTLVIAGVGEDAAVQRAVWQSPVDQVARLPGRRC